MVGVGSASGEKFRFACFWHSQFMKSLARRAWLRDGKAEDFYGEGDETAMLRRDPAPGGW